ncbi:MAG: PIN domain-containing protein [Bacteroidota bacterium]
MVIPDTSIWIEFFKQNHQITPLFQSLLKNREVATIESIFAELVFGVRNASERDIVIGYWEILPKLQISLIEAAEYAHSNNYYNLGVGLIDASIIKPTIDNNFKLWTLDKRISRVVADKYLF